MPDTLIMLPHMLVERSHSTTSTLSMLTLYANRLLNQPIEFVKSDWQQYYPSLVLPDHLHHYSIVRVVPQNPVDETRLRLIRTSRGIFGSHWMPALGQALNRTLFTESADFDDTTLVTAQLFRSLTIH